ncbi:MAG: GNAT family N-acetyltransferase [Anaerolineae bacterium]|nr:GNAT family N-acetyltransferase [Anaerolineae bacterium]
MLVGKKVVLRTLREADLDKLVDLIADVREMGDYWQPHLPSEIRWKNRLSETGWWEEDHGGLLITDHEDNLLGQILFFKPMIYGNAYELGYRIYRRENWGKGYMSEAVSLITAWLFEIKPVDRIQATAMVGNEGSQTVLERCGFQFEGVMRKAIFHQGKNQDIRLYSLLREECEPLKDRLGWEVELTASRRDEG